MKYPKEQLHKVEEHLPALIKILFEMDIKDILFVDPLLSRLHYLLFIQLTYPDSNPNVMNTQGNCLKVSGGNRLFPIDESFELYPNNCDDSNVIVAMNKVINNIINKTSKL